MLGGMALRPPRPAMFRWEHRGRLEALRTATHSANMLTEGGHTPEDNQGALVAPPKPAMDIPRKAVVSGVVFTTCVEN